MSEASVCVRRYWKPGKGARQSTMHEDTEAFFSAFGRRITELRKEREWTVHHMVVHHGFYEPQWRKYEKGVPVTVDTMLKIATIFGITLAELMAGCGTFPRPQATETHPAAEPAAPRKKRVRTL